MENAEDRVWLRVLGKFYAQQYRRPQPDMIVNNDDDNKIDILHFIVHQKRTDMHSVWSPLRRWTRPSAALVRKKITTRSNTGTWRIQRRKYKTFTYVY